MRFFGVVLLTAVLVADLPAQGPRLEPGARVRVTTRTSGIVRQRGELRQLTTDSIVVQFDRSATAIAIPVARLSRLEVATLRSRGSSAARGALIGLASGLVIGAVGGLMFESGTCEDCVSPLIGVAAGGAAGLLVGSIAGASRRGERWQVVPLRP